MNDVGRSSRATLRSWAAAMTVAGLVLGPVSGSYAADARNEVVSAHSPGDSTSDRGAVITFHVGDPTVTETPIPNTAEVSALTTAVVFDLNRPSAGPVACSISNLFYEYRQQWSAADWVADTDKRIDLPDGLSRGEEPTSDFEIFCYSDAWDITWPTRWTAPQGKPAVVRDPEQEESGRAVVRHYSAATQTIHPGDVIRVVGPPGTWNSTGAGDTRTFTGLTSSNPDDDYYTPDATINADASEYSFRVPTDLTADYGAGARVRITVDAEYRRTATPSTLAYEESNRADIPVTVSTTQPSSTTIEVNRRVVWTSRPVSVSVAVRSPDIAPPAGDVVVSVDGRAVATATLAGDGTAAITVPRPGRGLHTITAKYAGDGRIGPSTSAAVHIIVVR